MEPHCCNGGQVRVGIDAPDSVDIWQEEAPEESAA